MSKQEEDADHDFRCYLEGGEPSGVELATAPTLDIWSTDVIVRDGKSVIVLKGIVMKHPTHGDCERIVTSPVIWLDRHHRWARCRSRLYVLEGAEILVEGLPL